MARFLFWNVCRKELHREIAALTKDLRVDVILLAESASDDRQIVRALAEEDPGDPFEVPRFMLCQKIAVYLRHSSRFWTPLYEHPRYVIAKYSPPARAEVLVAAAHLPDRRNHSIDSINIECQHLATRIKETERKHNTNRTFLIGDLNLNPFDIGPVSASGLHGVMSKTIAVKGKRSVQGQDYPFFYNPMWGRLGDASVGPPGSYYFADSQQVTYFWHTFDQLLLRATLLEEFSEPSLRFVTTVREQELLRNGVPNSNYYSDHLPLVFDIELKPVTRRAS